MAPVTEYPRLLNEEKSTLGISLKDKKQMSDQAKNENSCVVKKAAELKWTIAGHVARGNTIKWHKSSLEMGK